MSHPLQQGFPAPTKIMIISTCKYHPKCHIHNTSFSSKLSNGPNKLECLSLANLFNIVQCNTSLLGPFKSFEENERCECDTWDGTYKSTYHYYFGRAHEVTKIMKCGEQQMYL